MGHVSKKGEVPFEDRLTVVVWVRGGVVEDVQADQPCRVLVCDFDDEDCKRSDIYTNRLSCAISDWQQPNVPDSDYFLALFEAL